MPKTVQATAKPARLQQHLDDFAQLSATEMPHGITRLAYSELEQQAHDAFATHMRNLGLTVTTDAAGNTIAELVQESSQNGAVIGTGSHLDSVPQGGRFDGVAGVVAAMEIATLLHANPTPLRHRLRFIAFRAEEGARFAQSCNGSRFATGLVAPEVAQQLRDASGMSMATAMLEVGLDPDRLAEAAWDPREWRAFVELHVEQGAMLERAGARIGVVSGISGSSRLWIRVTGQATHSGGTPMRLRKDALVVAADCVRLCHETAMSMSDEGLRITVGTMHVHPGSITTIPGAVEFTVDLRDHDADRQVAATATLITGFREIAEAQGLEVEIKQTGSAAPVALSHDVARFSQAAAEALGANFMFLRSGASHDCAEISKIVSAGLIFIPSIRGLSHVPEEDTALDDLALGTDVLLETILRIDAA